MQTQIKSKWTCGIIGALALIMTIISLSCEKQRDSEVKAQETTPELRQSVKQVQTPLKPSVASQRLSQALMDGKYVYLFFYELGNTDCETMGKNIDSFARKTKKNVEIIKVDRKDPKNSDIVTKLRTQTAPIPLTLVLEPNSAIVAAFTYVVTEDELSQAFPSPKKAEAVKYIQQGKGVILCFSNKGMPSRKGVQTCCSQAIDQLVGKAEYINVDLSDPKEAEFIKELRIDPNTPEPVTFVINPQGQVTGKYDGEVQVANLVEAATKVVKSGCCPPGSGKTCGPTTPKKK
jgi:hypothetical protein